MLQRLLNNETLEFNRFGIISMLLIIQAAMGGLAAGFGGIDNIYALSVLVVGTMLSQTFILAVAPMKLIVRFGALVTLINTIMFIYYISQG